MASTILDLPRGLQNLLRRLKAYDVVWNYTFVPADEDSYEVGIDREEVDLGKANVVSSEIRIDPIFGRKHVVAIDLDIPAYTVPSSTEGHSHLYIDVPGGIPHEDYMELLDVLAKCKIIERGYAEVSKKRGHSDLRLPWVKKADQKLATVEQQNEVLAARQPAVVSGADFDLIMEPF